MILKFNKFNLNESHNQDEISFNHIFIDIIDLGYKLEVEEVYYDTNVNGRYSNDPDQSHKIPGYVINLKMFTKSLNLDEISNIVDMLKECSDRISDIGDFKLEDVEFSNNGYSRIDYKLLDKDSKEADVNTSDGFDSFTSLIERKWREGNNKLTRSFKIGRSKEGLIFTLTDDTITGKKLNTLFTTFKALISKSVTRNYYMDGGPNWKYTYDIKLDGSKILVNFKDRIDETPVTSRRQNTDENW